ncbi:YgaP-like transmembrane domain [Syntrophomonas wolfei]|jgi:hypothetical protein|uniref:YgaP-like transmembrane domain n=1 Tax=Syntrophomonas wolfei TaxID=863 RepID=UPI0007733CE0|nr:YgaP-like transmembrane domain [Syntrophomonas wolfei]
MLSRDGVIARYILAFCFFFSSGSEMLTGWLATLSGILGCVELATALLKYSPLYELWAVIKNHYQQNKALE